MNAAGDGRSSDGYDASRAVFETVVVFLDSAEAAGLEHAELEDQLGERSRELFRRLFQDHLDQRAQREQRLVGVCDADGVERRARPPATPGHHLR